MLIVASYDISLSVYAKGHNCAVWNLLLGQKHGSDYDLGQVLRVSCAGLEFIVLRSCRIHYIRQPQEVCVLECEANLICNKWALLDVDCDCKVIIAAVVVRCLFLRFRVEQNRGCIFMLGKEINARSLSRSCTVAHTGGTLSGQTGPRSE